MKLSPVAFNRFLQSIGQQYTWRKAFACPCTNPNSGASKPNCPNCKGKGRFWAAPLPGITGVASAKVQKNWAQSGRFETGDTVLSVPSDTPLYQAGQFDRVVLLNASDEFSMTLTRGGDEVLHFPVVSIRRVFWLDADAGIVEGAIPAVDDDGAVSFPAGAAAPPDGAQYSITGVKRIEYFIYDTMPSNRGEHSGAALPKNIVARRFDTFGR